MYRLVLYKYENILDNTAPLPGIDFKNGYPKKEGIVGVLRPQSKYLPGKGDYVVAYLA